MCVHVYLSSFDIRTMNQCMILAVLLCWLGASQADLGDSSPQYGTCLCVTARSLNIRIGGGTSFRILKVAREGECFKYTEQKTRANGYDWYRVDYKGEAAWAAGKFLEIGSPSQCPSGPPDRSCMCVTATRLNIRSRASVSSSVLSTVNKDQCYRYTGQRQSGNGFFWLSLEFNGQEAWAAERYLRTSSNSECVKKKATDTYEGCTGSGRVDYQSKQVSDSKTRDKLEEIADYFCTRLYLFSGDRTGSGTSLHNVRRAADFWLDGFDAYNGAINIWDGLRASNLFNDEGWEVIWHGPHTITGGIHIHVGRYDYPRKTCFKMEGTTTHNVRDYSCHPL